MPSPMGGAKRGRPVGSPARDREAVGEVFVNGIRLKYIHNVFISFLLDDYFAMRSEFSFNIHSIII